MNMNKDLWLIKQLLIFGNPVTESVKLPILMWDNRVCLHHGVSDYFGEVAKHRRVMQRATIQGEIPIAATAAGPKAA